MLKVLMVYKFSILIYNGYSNNRIVNIYLLQDDTHNCAAWSIWDNVIFALLSWFLSSWSTGSKRILSSLHKILT